MRITAIILSALATVATYVGIFYYWVSMILACFDSCPPLADYSDRWLSQTATTLGPGVAFAVVATITGSLALNKARSRRAFWVTIAAPTIALVAVALIMLLGAGGFLPYADPAASSDPVDPTLSRVWLGGATYAAFPLAIWPLATCFALLYRLPSRQASAPAPANSISA